MEVEIFPAGWSPGLSHVLRKDVARSDTFHEHGAQISYQGRNEVLGLKSVGTADSSSFLAQRTKYATDHFGLAIEIHEAFFDEPGKFQIPIKLEMLLGLEGGLGRTA